jgi:hypothetical protein
MVDTSNIQLSMILSFSESIITANSSLSSKDLSPTTLQNPYQNQKGFLLENCLFICNFDMLFTSMLTGWEGSATDAWVWAEMG